MMNPSSQAIWQSKVAPDVQGRVFGVRRMIAWSAQIVGPLLAAPLADRIFKPALAPGGSLVPIMGPMFGVGASRGIGLMISLLGVLMLVVAIAGFANSRIRNVERDLPDHATSSEPTAQPAAGEPAD